MNDVSSADPIEAIRSFNRLYTHKIGVLQQGFLQSPWSLTQARILWELADRDGLTAKDLCSELGLDAGYLSRILRHFSETGLVRSKKSAEDGRRQLLALTAKGRKAFSLLNERSRKEVAQLLSLMSAQQQYGLLGAMHTISATLTDSKSKARSDISLREHRIGDMGSIVHRQALLYAQEYGWNAEFEALISEITAKFLREFKAGRERCWVAQRDGEILGCVFIIQRTKTCAQLRLLYVEPAARGLGLGKQLVDECTSFARAAGYRKIMLWTNKVLHAARSLYVQAGYQLIEEETHHSFGHAQVGQIWELKL